MDEALQLENGGTWDRNLVNGRWPGWLHSRQQ